MEDILPLYDHNRRRRSHRVATPASSPAPIDRGIDGASNRAPTRRSAAAASVVVRRPLGRPRLAPGDHRVGRPDRQPGRVLLRGRHPVVHQLGAALRHGGAGRFQPRERGALEAAPHGLATARGGAVRLRDSARVRIAHAVGPLRTGPRSGSTRTSSASASTPPSSCSAGSTDPGCISGITWCGPAT